MVSAENLFNSPYCMIPFNIHINASDKQLGSVISHKNKPI